MKIISQFESNVRCYCRHFPDLFVKAKDSFLISKSGKKYLDFFSGAGTINYGHNNIFFKKDIINYIENDGIIHALDIATEAKQKFLSNFQNIILKPRKLKYKVQFSSPAGTDSVESAIKLARKVKKRHLIIHFTNSYHGMTLGALALTSNSFKRNSAGVPLENSRVFPYDGYLGDNFDTLIYLEKILNDTSGGVDLPAAVIVETIQGEGGINVASFQWLKKLEQICKKFDILLIIDDIQVGCGRTGKFFSFEKAKINPDIVCLAKAISGYGLPMAVTLIKPKLDIWKSGEHAGTFRGNNLAFVSAAKALEIYWQNDSLEQDMKIKSKIIQNNLEKVQKKYSKYDFVFRGRGMIFGLESRKYKKLAQQISAQCFQRGLILETSGGDSQVLKFLPSLTITEKDLHYGFKILDKVINNL